MRKIQFLFVTVLTAMAASAATYTFTDGPGVFSNGGGSCATANGSGCTVGDLFTSADGFLKATAWNTTGGVFSTAQLFKSGGVGSPPVAPYVGLGVCNAGEGTHTDSNSACTNEEGYVDNLNSLDVVLFVFNTPVDPTQLTINATIHAGTDTQWWYSNLTTLAGVNLSDLGGASGTSSSSTINLSGVQSVRSVIFSARTPTTTNSDNYDGVKVTSLSVNAVPEPATFGLAGLALAGLGLLRRRIRVS